MLVLLILYIIHLKLLATANLSTNTNDNSRLEIDPKVLTIIAAAPGSGQSRYLSLINGVYNGQIKKIALHPMWNGTNIDIKVSRFVTLMVIFLLMLI